MNEARVVTVGGSPALRAQVARAVGRDVEAVAWTPNVAAAEGLLGGEELFDLAVLWPSVSEADAIAFAQSVGSVSPLTAVILVRDQPPDGALRELIRAGIRDVVDLSRGGEELQDALGRAVTWAAKLRLARGGQGAPGPEAPGRVFTVFSSKGGSGKTFLACNLAAVIAQLTGEDTAVLDLSLEMGDVLASFGKEAAGSLQELTAIQGWADPESVRRLGTRLHKGLWGFGSGSEPGEAAGVARGMGKAVRTLRSTFAYTVLDTPPSYSDHVLGSFDVSDEICLITVLDVIGIRHLTMDLHTLTALGLSRDRLRIALNRANSRVGLSPQDVERVTGIQPDALIPSSPLVPASLNQGKVVCIHEPRSPVARAIQAFADVLLTAPPVKPLPATTAIPR